jgi:hypothetical protein
MCGQRPCHQGAHGVGDDDGPANAEGVQDGRDVLGVRGDADPVCGRRAAGAGEIGTDDLVGGFERFGLYLEDVGGSPDTVQEHDSRRKRSRNCSAAAGSVAVAPSSWVSTVPAWVA